MLQGHDTFIGHRTSELPLREGSKNFIIEPKDPPDFEFDVVAAFTA
jgi:hypothetical protein